MNGQRSRDDDRPWLALITRAEAHDVDGVLEYCHPDVVWETRWPGFESQFRGRAGVRRFFEGFEEAITAVRPRLRVLREDGDRVLVEMLLTGQGVGSGAPVEMFVYDIWTFRDRLLWRRQTFHVRDEAIAELAEPSAMPVETDAAHAGAVSAEQPGPARSDLRQRQFE